MPVPHRDLAPFLRWFRNALLGRKFKNSLRFQDLVATRSPPPPNLPDGVHHKLSENYYFTRDGRHAVRPPQVLIEDTKKLALTAGTKENTKAKSIVSVEKLGRITPGKPYYWEEVPNQAAQ